MKKSKHRQLFISVAIALTTLFISSVAFAFYDNSEPEGDFTISTTFGNKFVVTLVSIDEDPSNPLPYQWNYTITNKNDPNKLTGVNFFAMLIPDCMKDPKIVINPISFGSYQSFGVAEGENVLSFGLGIEQGYVIKGVSDGDTNWSFLTNTNTVTYTSAIIKDGNKEYSKEIPGPGCTPIINCPVPETRVDPREQCFVFTSKCDDGTEQVNTWTMKWDGSDPCAVEVKVAEGTPGSPQPCGTGEVIEGEVFGNDIYFKGEGIPDQPLSDALINNSACDEGWLRFKYRNGL